MRKEVLIALALLTLASCATMVSYETARESLQRAGTCCESMAQFRYDPLAKGEGVRFNLDASSTAFNFESGKSYFKAFRLVEEAIPYRISVSSFALGETIDKAHIFYPQIALLDERFAILAQSARGDFVLRKMGLSEAAGQTMGLMIKLEGSILVDSPRARYVLVFTTQELMAGSSLYETRRVVPVILPGFVTAIPGDTEMVRIRYSPFAMLHVSITPADAKPCPGRSEADIQPSGSVAARFTGRDAHRFVAAVEPGADATQLDTVVVLRGPEVLGGTAAFVFKDGCFAGRKFLSGLDYIHAVQMVALFRASPALQEEDRLEMATLSSMAEAGDPAAQFHVGLMYAWGRGVPTDRRASIEWLERAARRNFSPAMLALGMALSGPGVILDEVRAAGKPQRTDPYTDLVAAYSWLDAASRASEPDIRAEAELRLQELAARMSPDELRRAKAQK